MSMTTGRRSLSALRRSDVGSGRRRGYVLLFVAVVGVVLLGIAGLAADVGYTYLMRTRLQTTAEAAARAAALEIAKSRPDEAQAAARQDAGLHGINHGVGGVTVQYSRPPTSGEYTTESNAAEVIITKPSPLFFLQVFNLPSVTLRARAVAQPGSSPICVWALSTSDSQAMQVDDDVTAQCGVFVNSSSSSALSTGSGDCLVATSVQVVGGTSLNCVPTPAPTTGVDPKADPLASLPAPAVGSCTHWNYETDGSGTKTINPGVYCGGIRHTDDDVTLVFNPGIYILVGGGLHIHGGCAARGDGVMFYNTYNGSYSYSRLHIDSQATISLRAPTSGTYAGVLVFQNRSAPFKSDETVKTSSSAVIEGAIYLSKSKLKFSVNSTASRYTLLVARDILFDGLSRINADYSSVESGSPIKGGGPAVLE